MAWDDLIGQADAIATMRAAAAGDGLTHSWLITGPPGSGRSTLAYAFAAALLARPGTEVATEAQVTARTHPDLGVLSTERVLISIDEVRQLVASSQFSPSVGRYRVMVIEDADRMRENASNVLLKALEEPPPRTVWILCAPSEADLIPTIRSRVRTVRLRVPAVEEVAALLERRDGVSRNRDPRSPGGTVPHRHGPPAGDQRAGTRSARVDASNRARHPLCFGCRECVAGTDGFGRRMPRQSPKNVTRGARKRHAQPRDRARWHDSPGPPHPAQEHSTKTRNAARRGACATASTASWSTCSRSTATSC